MTKDDLIALIGDAGQECYLSAQVYNQLTETELGYLESIFTDRSEDYDVYKTGMLSSFPKTVSPPSVTWRTR